MRSRRFQVTKGLAFDTCKKALRTFDCEITSSDINVGEIEAKKGGNFLSFGHKLKVTIKETKGNGLRISVFSNSVGPQVIDWGTNSDNEEKLLKIITAALA